MNDINFDYPVMVRVWIEAIGLVHRQTAQLKHVAHWNDRSDADLERAFGVIATSKGMTSRQLLAKYLDDLSRQLDLFTRDAKNAYDVLTPDEQEIAMLWRLANE